MADKYWWESEDSNSQSQGYWWDDGSVSSTVGKKITDSVNSWLQNHRNYVSNYQKRTAGRKYTYEDDYVKDPNDWLNTVSQQKRAFDESADSILAYMDQYKGYLDADWMKSVRDTLTSARGQQEIVVGNATADSKWWQNFANEEEYKTAQRYDGYSKKYTGQKYEDIQKALSLLDEGSEEKWWLSQTQYDLYKGDSNYTSKATSGLKSYEAQKTVEHEREADKKWWERVAENYAYSSPDTSLPAASLSIVTAGYRNDTSYREPNENWSEGERRQFGYLYAEDPKKAYAYAEQVNNEYNAYEKYLQQQQIGAAASKDGWSMAGHTLGAIATAPMGLADYLDDMAEYAGRGTITQKNTITPFEYGQAAQSGVADKLNEMSGTIDDDVFIFGGKGVGDLYNLGVSTVNSIVSSKLGSVGTLVNFFGQGAASGVDDALARGANAEQALLYGGVMGALEGITEKMSIDKLLKVGSASTFKNWLVNSMNQGLGELQEEGLSSLFGNIADNIIMGDKSNFHKTVEELMDADPKLSEEAAKKAAWKKMAGDIAFDAIGGFVSGTASGGYQGAKNTIKDSRKGNQKNIDAINDYGDRTDDLIQEGLANDKKSDSYKLAQKYQKQTQGKDGKAGKAMTGYQIRNLLAANQEQISAKDIQRIEEAAAERLVKLGQREDIFKTAELATKYATGGKLTRAETSFLTRSQYGSQLASELLPKNILPGDDSGIGSDGLLSKWENDVTKGWGENYSTEWAEDIGTKNVNAMAYNKKAIEAQLTQVKAIIEEMKKPVEDPAQYKTLESRVEAEEPVQVSDTGKSVIRGTDQEIDLAKPTFKEITDNGVMLEADGKLVSADNIDYADENLGYAIKSVGKIENITPEAAGAVVSLVDMSKPVVAQMNGLDEAFTYGFHNYSEADLEEGLFTSSLTKEQMNDAYKLGQYVRKNSGDAKTTAIKQMRTAAQVLAEKSAAEGKETPKAKKLAITYNHGNGVTEDIETAMEKLGELTDEQRGGIEVAKILHQMGIGTDFELFSSYYSKTLKDKDGNPLEVFLNDEGQEEAAYAGVYMAADGKIRINLNAYSGTKGLTLNAMSHELTHFIKDWSLEKYETMAEFLVKSYGEHGVSMHQLVLKEQARLKRIRGAEVSYGEAYDEVVANAFNRMLEDGKVLERIAELRKVDKSLTGKIIEGIRKFIKRFMKVYKDNESLFMETEALMEMKEVFEQLQEMFAEALVDASDNFQAAQMVGFELDTQTESVAPAVVMKSENTWRQSDYVQERDKAAKEIAKAIGVSEKKAKDYIDSINSIAKMIAEDRSRLDYFSSPGRTSFVGNVEYGGSFDFSTLCKKRRLLTGTFTAIQKALPNTALTAEEILDIRNRMKKANLEVSCGLCYVEGSRANMGQFAKEFLRLYKQYYPDAWQPNMADVNTPDGIEWVRINHPECYEQYEYFWNHYGTLKDGDKNLFASQQKPKLYQLHTEYKGEILDKFKGDDNVEEKNLNGGIRLQSFSDFEIVHLIDTMQIIMDMSRVGLAGQAYTKVPDFAWALGDTGLKINLSLIAKGVDENGKLIFDDVEGMPIAEAMKLRDRYSKNVGTILVAFNDEQLLAAMADDRVDFIIPFHRSQWKKSQYEAMGLPAKTKDYTYMQNEKFIKPQYHKYRGRMVKDKATNYMPNEYWDFSKSGKENAEAYLEMCARNNKRPKFYKLLQNNGDGSYSLKADGSTDGYWKLLIDFKMYDNEGNGSPQMAVKPEFNMEEANRMLETYKGGHSNFPVAQGIVDGFVKDYKASHKGVQYSSQETDLDTNTETMHSYKGLAADAFYKNSDIYSYDFLVNQKPMVVVENVPSLSEVQTNGKIDYGKVVELGLDNVKENGGVKKGDVYLLENSYTGRPLQISKNSITHGLGAESGNAKRTNARLGAVIGQICKNAIPINGVENTHNVRGTYVLASLIDTTIGGDKLFIVALVNVEQQSGVVQSVEFLDVAHALSGRKLNDQTIEKENRAALSPRSGTKSDSESQFSTINIVDFLGIVNSTHQGFLSDDVVNRLGVERRGPKKGLFSTQQTDNITNRHLLANAFEGISQSSIEYKMIQQYKGYIAELNSLEKKLSEFNQEIRQIRFGKGEYDAEKLARLEDEARKIAEAINKHDKKLLSMEASEPLRKVIDRERKKEAQKTKDHVKQIQENKKVRAEQAELRHKIRKAVRDLDKLLKHGNKQKNVKQDMKGFVSKALDLADYLFTDHISNDELIRRGIDAELIRGEREAQLVHETEEIIAKLDATTDITNADSTTKLTDEEFMRLDAKRKSNEEKLKDLLTAQRNKRLSTPVYQLFDDLVNEYAKLENSSQDAVKAAYNVDLLDALRGLMGDDDQKEVLKNMRVADMTTKELDALLKAYKMVLVNVRDANKIHAKVSAMTIGQMADRITKDFGNRKIPNKQLAIAAQKIANKIGWNYEKLYYALDRIGSDAFTELFMTLADSENIVMQDIIEAEAFRDDVIKAHGYNDWAVNKEIDREFLDNTGKKFKLTLAQVMALYAYTRREGAWDHLEYGGFVFGKAALTNPRPADSYKLTKEQCESITSLLTKEQKAFAEEMQKYLSETMGAKGNEVSMKLHGIELFGEKNYFPIHVAGQYMARAQESQAKAAAGFQTMSNAGFTHAQNRKAKSPIVLEGFMEVWTDHVNEMSRYHGTVPALEDIRRVMNRSTYSDSTSESTSIKQQMINAYGEEAAQYFDNLYREANSGAITDKLQYTSKKLLSLFRKNSVAYSLSVLIQQPASITRAYALIDKKYFGFKGFGAISSGIAKAMSDKWTKAHTDAYNEMLKYAPGVTMAKEIGGFDTATGGSIRSYLLDTNKSLKQKWKTGTIAEKGNAVMDLVDNNAVANLPNVADKIAWIEIWNACKRETVAKHKDLKPGGEEFMQAVGERFTEVIRATQVYDSIFAKSPMLKSKNLAVQYLVSFMNEPNTVANMAESVIRDVAKGDWKGGLRKSAVLINSIIFTGVLKSMVYAMRDDDEDETYIEKYIESLTGSLMDDFNALNYIPLARDVVSLAQGYDVERADMAIVADAVDALYSVIKNRNKDTEDMTEEQLIEFDKKCTEANWKLAESLAAFFGIPVKNIRREIMGVMDHARIAKSNKGLTTSYSTWKKIQAAVTESIPFMKTETKQDKLYEAILKGDTQYVARLKSGYKTGDAYHTAIRKVLRENDPRIHEAAQAKYEGNGTEYKRIFKEIQKEGKFSFDDIMEAINSELNAIKKEVEPASASSNYSSTDFVNAMILGETSAAQAMREDIIKVKVANGKTQEEAEESFADSIATATRNAFDSGLLNEAGAKKILLEYAGMDEEDAASKTNYWAFCKAHPQYDLTQSNVEKYHEFAEPAEIPLDVYVQFVRETKDIGTIYDEWGEEVKSKKEQVLEVIDSLPLSWRQKDALYFAAEYKESTISDVPW